MSRQRLWNIKARPCGACHRCARAAFGLRRQRPPRESCWPRRRSATSTSMRRRRASARCSSPTTTRLTRRRTISLRRAEPSAPWSTAGPSRRQPLAPALKDAGVPLHTGSVIAATHGDEAGPLRHRREARSTMAGSSSEQYRIYCDSVLVSGGWNPAVHLFSQSAGKLTYEEVRGIFLPGTAPRRHWKWRAPRAMVSFGLAACLAEGCCRRHAGGGNATGFGDGTPPPVPPVGRAGARRDHAFLARAGPKTARPRQGQAHGRPPGRRDRGGHPARRTRGFSVGRARQTLHHRRHGHGPG